MTRTEYNAERILSALAQGMTLNKRTLTRPGKPFHQELTLDAGPPDFWMDAPRDGAALIAREKLLAMAASPLHICGDESRSFASWKLRGKA